MERGRSDDADGGVGKRALGQLLNELDGVSERKGVLVIAATSHPEKVDPALTRPGRFDQHVYIGLPSTKDIVDIVNLKKVKMAIADDVDVDMLASVLTGATCATVDAVCREAAMCAFRESGIHTVVVNADAFITAVNSSVGKQRPLEADLVLLENYKSNGSLVT